MGESSRSKSLSDNLSECYSAEEAPLLSSEEIKTFQERGKRNETKPHCIEVKDEDDLEPIQDDQQFYPSEYNGNLPNVHQGDPPDDDDEEASDDDDEGKYSGKGFRKSKLSREEDRIRARMPREDTSEPSKSVTAFTKLYDAKGQRFGGGPEESFARYETQFIQYGYFENRLKRSSSDFSRYSGKRRPSPVFEQVERRIHRRHGRVGAHEIAL